MIESSLIKILTTISSAEMRRFQDFAHSPYFTNYTPLIKLVDLLKELHPFSDLKSIEKERIYAQVFSKSQFDYATLRALFSKTLQLFEQYLATEKFKNDRLQVEQNALQSLANKKIVSRFDKKEKAILKTLKNIEQEDENHLLRFYEYYKTKDSYFVKNENYSQRHLLTDREHFLDSFYLLEKLKISVELLNRSLFFKDNVDQAELEILDQTLSRSENLLSNYSLIRIYALIYKTMRFPSEEENYRTLKKLTVENSHKYSNDEMREIYVYTLNYIIRKINAGQTEFINETFHQLRTMLEEGYIVNNGAIEEWHYKNLITSGIRSGEFDFVESFIEDYSKYLPKASQKTAYRYNLANLFYAQKKYIEAQKLLLEVDYSDINYNLDSKTLLLRIYYDADESLALGAHINTVKIYLTRNKLISNRKYRRYYHLFRFTNSLYKIKENITYSSTSKTQQRLDKLETDITKVKAISNKQWLISRLTHLKEELDIKTK